MNLERQELKDNKGKSVLRVKEVNQEQKVKGNTKVMLVYRERKVNRGLSDLKVIQEALGHLDQRETQAQADPVGRMLM